MDEKLARGLARELFRNLQKRTSLETDPATPIVRKLLETYEVHGGVAESNLRTFAADLENQFRRLDQATVSSRFLRHPVKSRVVLETVRPGCVPGSEQPGMIARCYCFVFQRNVLKVIETVSHVSVAQHAVFRLFERGNMKSDSIVELVDSITLWVPTLLFTLFGPGGARVPNSGPVVLPFASGLLLGNTGRNYLEGPRQGPSITDFRRGGRKLRRLAAPFELDEGIPTISINTYVSNDELFDNQRQIVKKLVNFADRYRALMTKLRALCALGYPDQEVMKLLGEPDFEASDVTTLHELADLICRFFETPEWSIHARASSIRSTRTPQ
ncbi:hypothetical protein [Bradyrhizobium sp. F1.13.3]|uniref:hypothetical protein n=1 Tax=Bradyrhizobium sp. F1.13.3 TaxID=3156351 RepID=UPI0033959938